MDNPLPPAVVLPLPPKPHSVGFTYTFEQCKVDGFIKSVDIIENIVTLSEYGKNKMSVGSLSFSPILSPPPRPHSVP